MEQKYPLTKEGNDRLTAELKNLKSVERPAVINAIAEARTHGDLSENAEYHAAREKQSFIEGRIQELEAVLSRAEVIDISSLSGKKVLFGAQVQLYDEVTDKEISYRIVGEHEADITRGLISTTSPIGRALLGRQEGDVVEVKAPAGLKTYEIISVAFK